jgi:hypothetical protein
MMISIIVSDTTVVRDGVGYDDMDLSSLAANIYAIQFNTTTSKGHIEYNDGTVNEDITSITPYQSIVDAHIAKKTANDSDKATVESDQTALEATYSFKRKHEYPSIGDQLDALYHAGTFDSTMTAAIKAVKDKYPKP